MYNHLYDFIWVILLASFVSSIALNVIVQTCIYIYFVVFVFLVSRQFVGWVVAKH